MKKFIEFLETRMFVSPEIAKNIISRIPPGNAKKIQDLIIRRSAGKSFDSRFNQEDYYTIDGLDDRFNLNSVSQKVSEITGMN